MISTFLLALISLIILLIIHELGHFLVAKRFGVEVEEFGVGYPPRIAAKKFGSTVYSLNWLPFGAFVRMKGEEEREDSSNSFSQQSVFKRILIALAGVFSFWLIAAVLFAFVFKMGVPTVVSDSDVVGLTNFQVVITDVTADSPAGRAGLQPGDVIDAFIINNSKTVVDKISQVKQLTNDNKGQAITLVINRNNEFLNVDLTPRISFPEGEGSMGISLFRVALKKYPWHSAPWQGILASLNMTLEVIRAYGSALDNIISGQEAGIQLVGPIGVFQMLMQSQQMGISYFFNFLALISVQLAIFNLLPIPAMDGGKVVFLAIEAVRKKPVSQKIEQNVTAASFLMLLVLMIWVTIRDISNLF